jgi:hypothetical protein
VKRLYRKPVPRYRNSGNLTEQGNRCAKPSRAPVDLSVETQSIADYGFMAEPSVSVRNCSDTTLSVHDLGPSEDRTGHVRIGTGCEVRFSVGSAASLVVSMGGDSALLG